MASRAKPVSWAEPGEGPGRQGVKLQEDLDVRPGDEGPAGPGEQEHPNPRVPAHPVQGVTKLREHLVVQGIELVRTVEGDGGDSGLVVKQNGLIRHGSSFENQPGSYRPEACAPLN